MVEKTKIFFDGNCIVCDSEISHYKRLAPDVFELIDINSPDFDAAKYGLNSERVQQHMYVMTPGGQILRGVDAFTHIWARLDRYRIAARIIQLPVIYQVAKIGYDLFARNRHLLPKKKITDG